MSAHAAGTAGVFHLCDHPGQLIRLAVFQRGDGNPDAGRREKPEILGGLADGVAMCLTVTLLDGLVLARSAFHHSLNYRSVVALGVGRVITDPAHKRDALRAIVERVAPGRSDDVRGPSDQELAATEVVALTVREASAKLRSGPPGDASDDYQLPVWAGELPLELKGGTPVADERCRVPLPAYLKSYERAAG